MADDFNLGDYIQVPERLDKFYEKYPDGRVSSSPPIVVEIEGDTGKHWEIGAGDGGEEVWMLVDGPDASGLTFTRRQTYIQVTTTVYRSDEDRAPCQASAWELFPGKTRFTKESEMMNAETSAVGRALWAVGIEAKRGAASREDVQKAREAQDSEPTSRTTKPQMSAGIPPKVDTGKDVKDVQTLYGRLGVPDEERKGQSAKILGLDSIATHNDLIPAQLVKIKIELGRRLREATEEAP